MRSIHEPTPDKVVRGSSHTKWCSMNKKGFELSINFIVILIITIVVFSAGIYITQRIFQEANKIKAQLDSDSEANIRILLDRGERFAIPISTKETKPGQTVTFGVGLLNVKSNETDFAITVTCSGGVTPGQQTITNACSSADSLISDPSRELKPNEQVIIPVAIRVSGQKGTYIFTVSVKVNGAADNSNYPPKQIYVNIV